MGHSKSGLEGLGFTQHETGKRELESLSKPIGGQVEHLPPSRCSSNCCALSA